MFSIKIISLKKDRFKRELILQQLENLNLAEFAQVVDAVDGKLLSTKILMDKSSQQISSVPILFHRPLTAGEIGCSLSHQAIYQSMEEGDICLILEDDAILSSELIEFIGFLGKLPSNWDVVHLGSDPYIFRMARTSVFGRKKLGKFTLGKPIEQAWGTYSYLISYKGARKLIQATKTTNAPIDYFTGNSNVVNLWVLKKPITEYCKELLEFSNLAYERDLLEKSIYIENTKSIIFKNFIKTSFLYHPLRYILLVLRRISSYLRVFRIVRSYN
jgi:glycosyl transferase, family 25